MSVEIFNTVRKIIASPKNVGVTGSRKDYLVFLGSVFTSWKKSQALDNINFKFIPTALCALSMLLYTHDYLLGSQK